MLAFRRCRLAVTLLGIVSGAAAAPDVITIAIDGKLQNVLFVAPAAKPAPIWLLGTSAGAPAALAGAANLPVGAIRGAAISSPVSTPGPHDSVFDVALARIGVPVLIQIHQDDHCLATPPANAARIKAALTAAPVVEVQQFSGGTTPRSVACEAYAQHGFIGIEDQVVAAAANWIVKH